MDDVATQYGHVTVPKRCRARRLHPTAGVFGKTTPEDVVLAAAIHADDRAMMVVVRQSPLAGAPHHVENGQVRGTNQNPGESTRLFTQSGDDVPRFGDSAANDLTNGVTAAFRESGPAIGGETINVEHW